MRVTIDIPDYWTSEQALAVFELLDELRDRILDRYREQIVEHIQADRQTPEDDAQLKLPLFPFNDDIPF
jgi:hypothetical protein